MPMDWSTICGQSGSGSALSFLGMWIAMMAAMMLPSLLPVLLRYRRATGYRRTALVGAGYFLVWSAVGGCVFALDGALRSVLPAGLVVLAAGLVQFTPWKARRLACCRNAGVHDGTLPAWRHGLRLGLDCVACCANLTAVLLVVGVMDVAAMALVTAAINLERLAPAGEKAARAVGALIVAVGLALIGTA
jgi:predicted metal-binding membrane protein